MRLAVYNVENLFDRARAMNRPEWEKGRPVLEAFAELTGLLNERRYSANSKKRMIALMRQLGLGRSDTGEYAVLQRNRGGLVRRPRTGGMEIIADGRGDWVGSLDLRDEAINETAIRNKARVIRELDADVLGLVEAEGRTALIDFNDNILTAAGEEPYHHVAVIDGNDTRKIDVGLMTREDFPIGHMRSHADDRDREGRRVFSRDCAEFSVGTAVGNTFMVLVTHLKSKGNGDPAAADALRRRQAERVKEVYDRLTASGVGYIAVMGDLNDMPGSHALEPVLEKTDLQDVFTHPSFENGDFPGTFGVCNDGDKLDYLLMSPALFAKVEGGGVVRKGMWPGAKPARWDAFPDLTRPEEAASHHAAIWVDLKI